MKSRSKTMNEEPQTLIVREVTSWPGVTLGDTGRGGTQFNYGNIELGHLHGKDCADLPFTRKIRDELIAAGRVTVHPPLPDSGWVRRTMHDAGDVRAVLELFQLNYERARRREERQSRRADQDTLSDGSMVTLGDGQ
jgi:hypothetical protein